LIHIKLDDAVGQSINNNDTDFLRKRDDQVLIEPGTGRSPVQQALTNLTRKLTK
jgi:hypothetical protein